MDPYSRSDELDLIRELKRYCSHSLVIGGACFTIYLAANIFPYPVILLPASAIVGTGDAILWNAQGVGSNQFVDQEILITLTKV